MCWYVVVYDDVVVLCELCECVFEWLYVVTCIVSVVVCSVNVIVHKDDSVFVFLQCCVPFLENVPKPIVLVCVKM